MIKAEFTVFGLNFAEIERTALVVARKFVAAPEPELSYDCEQLISLGRWKAEVTARWEPEA